MTYVFNSSNNFPPKWSLNFAAAFVKIGSSLSPSYTPRIKPFWNKTYVICRFFTVRVYTITYLFVSTLIWAKRTGGGPYSRQRTPNYMQSLQTAC